ncbi:MULTISPECIES: SGNH/GDSL hydrolase family protein [Okeania]|uniref:SGNH/GDSL hydrolase family protein n=1 Tax=Okeania hirsuta TaxID=1458930 RepID=A0A3N6PIE2_9CYAN|nr:MULTISPECIES: SGNH/GDSL hydrolase family protein [Okeania]NES78033.1 SGNH/GDSL hydrolase family protein [Okeania sp. SIO1H4]NET21888.1 SGNH/GDSL hydrolase family protein [Okeania sp. SIO1H5]NET79142.1 SGNH/GDSL hydrolase family protein [Okeania sp. SIO1F9]NET94803.1 SGNH/GDSL hydrolase family protein [Okeania sp. SIO1H2]RQH21689.1 SGNH/GDSL hydrolase family protein [Okeania hirsuta]
MKILLIISALILGLLGILEIGLRVIVGFGNPLTYIADNQIGYLLTPNQNVSRFGNRIKINQYSMRSKPIEESKENNTLRIFLVGDSVANGNWWTDQNNTVSAIIENSLSEKLGKDKIVEVLNASANSWGPRNELAYLEKFGLFNSQIVILLINTDDLFAKAPSSSVVGVDRNYPDKKPPSAIAELINRYFFKAPKVPEIKEEGDRVGFNLVAIKKIYELANLNNAKFILAMTPLLREVGEPGPRDYEIKTRKRLEKFTQAENILYLDLRPIFKSVSEPDSLYRDHIHLSPEGNLVISEVISKSILEQNQL